MCNKVFKNGKKERENEKNGDKTSPEEGQDIPSPEESEENADINFNFFTYLKYLCSQVIFGLCPKFKWKSMRDLNDKLEETRIQLNIDTLLQKITFYEKSFHCIFDEDQIMLLYLQEKLSIEELKEQRMIMNLDQDEE